MLAAPFPTRTLRVWDTGSEGRRTLPGLLGTAPVAWAPDGSMLAVGASDGTVRLWDTKTWRQSTEVVGNGYRVSSLSWCPGRPLLAFSTKDGVVKLFDTVSGHLLELEEHPSSVNCVAWSPNQPTLLVSGTDDAAMQLWDFSADYTSYEFRTLRGHDDSVQALAWSPRGEMLASAGGNADPTIRIWDPKVNVSKVVGLVFLARRGRPS